jgi:hypothetical protein
VVSFPLPALYSVLTCLGGFGLWRRVHLVNHPPFVLPTRKLRLTDFLHTIPAFGERCHVGDDRQTLEYPSIRPAAWQGQLAFRFRPILLPRFEVSTGKTKVKTIFR